MTMPFRAFIAVEVGPSEKMGQFHSSLRETGAPLKLVDLDNLHLTLKFLGNTEEDLVPRIVQIIEDSLKGMSPFSIGFQGTGAFPGLKHMKVVWVGVRSAERLKSIASYLNDELAGLGFKREKRRFSPHLTLARVKGARHKDRLAEVIRSWSDEEFGDLQVSGLFLKKSVLSPKGPTYSTVHEAKMENP
ncbi:MAG: RNA 2',3'-cyclic phosphodiesterase [Methanomassiliicoccales archaeon]|nr:MAG: RNA 2',3'-cyclic phosphodiesterase [Methanomassiliicoccales archaeon]